MTDAMNSTQLQLDLWQELKEAEQTPEQCDLNQLCNGLEAAITTIPLTQQLKTAAAAFFQIAEIFVLRAEILLNDWEQTHSDEGPALEEDDLSELLRQSMSLELDELIAEPEPYTRQFPSHTPSVESVAVSVDKAALLEAFDSEIELVEAVAHATSAAMALAEEEDVPGWARVIAQWMQQKDDAEAISLDQLQQELRMPVVEVWMGVLLSQEQQFELEQRGEFYSVHGVWLRQGSFQK